MPPGGAKSRRGDLSHLLLDHVRRLLDGGDLLGTLLVERDLELLLERHHDLDGVEGVGTEVNELGVSRDGVEVGAQLLGDDGAHLLEGVSLLRFFRVSTQERRSVFVSFRVHPRDRGSTVSTRRLVPLVRSVMVFFRRERELGRFRVFPRANGAGDARSTKLRSRGGTYRGGEDTEARLGDNHGARLEGGGGASAELHLFDRTRGEKDDSVSMVT